MVVAFSLVFRHFFKHFFAKPNIFCSIKKSRKSYCYIKFVLGARLTFLIAKMSDLTSLLFVPTKAEWQVRCIAKAKQLSVLLLERKVRCCSNKAYTCGWEAALTLAKKIMYGVHFFECLYPCEDKMSIKKSFPLLAFRDSS